VAAAQREVDEEVSDEARAQFKKTAGNEAFKEGNFQQAAFFYMQVLTVLVKHGAPRAFLRARERTGKVGSRARFSSSPQPFCSRARLF
jgi:hypothetical protein